MGANYDPSAVSHLQPGMTRAEVVALMGQPNAANFMSDEQEVDVGMFNRASGLTSVAAA